MTKEELRLELFREKLLELVALAHKACSAIDGLEDPGDAFARLQGALAGCIESVAEYEAVWLKQEPGWIPVEKDDSDGN